MKHSRLTAATLAVDGQDLPLVYADVVAVERDNSLDPDWECVAATRVDVEIHLAPCALTLATPEGVRMRGDAIVVRTDGRHHVFRGFGRLAPFETAGPTH